MTTREQQREQQREQRREKQERRGARRKGVAPSTSLRPHFVSLARQVSRWADNFQKRPVSIGVTSLNAQAGRSTISFNLASALTSVNREKVLLVEADFGKHYITRRIGEARSTGLAEVLLGFAEPAEVVHETPLNNLQVIGCGRKSGQEALELPFDLLGNVMAEQFDEYGFTIYDLPVASDLTSCFSIASQLDGIILAVEANQIDQRHVNRFRRRLENVGVEILGVVINKS